MKFRSLIRKPVENNDNLFVQEPTAGIMSSFAMKLHEFPRLGTGEEDRIDTILFSGARVLVCLFEDKVLCLAGLVNHLNDSSTSEWPIRILETDSPRQILDAIDTPYFVRIIEWFIEQLPAGEFSNLQHLVNEVWPVSPAKGNE